eukprot:7036574-Pyramimonas_sp.AAC.1
MTLRRRSQHEAGLADWEAVCMWPPDGRTRCDAASACAPGGAPEGPPVWAAHQRSRKPGEGRQIRGC